MSYANTGFMYPVFAKLTSHQDGQMPVYDTGHVIHEARVATITKEYSENPLYGDNRIVDDDNGLTGLTIEFESTGIDDNDRKLLFGEEAWGTTGQWESDNETPYGGFGYIRRMKGDTAGRKYEAWLTLKIKFQETRQEARTQEGNQITWGTPTLSGRAAALDVDGGTKLRFRLHQTFDNIAAAKSWINTMLNVSAATT